jgi:hypothetical protein
MMLEHQKSQETKSRMPDLVDDNWAEKQEYDIHISRTLFQEDSRCSDTSNTYPSNQNSNPLACLDINSDFRRSYFAHKKHDQTIKCKEKKKTLKEHKVRIAWMRADE